MFTTVRNSTNGTAGSVVLNHGYKCQSLHTVIGRSKVSQDHTRKWVRTVGKWRGQLPLGIAVCWSLVQNMVQNGSSWLYLSCVMFGPWSILILKNILSSLKT